MNAHQFRETARFPWMTLALCSVCGCIQRTEHEDGRTLVRFLYKNPDERELRFTSRAPACTPEVLKHPRAMRTLLRRGLRRLRDAEADRDEQAALFGKDDVQ